MLRMTYGTVSLGISRMDLLDAAKKFVLRAASNEDLVLLENVHSPRFGSSDLLFMNRASKNLTIAKLIDESGNERFIISSICYYLWLVECITAGRAFFNAKARPDMYLFSHEFSDAIHYLCDNIWQVYPIHLIRYALVNVEGLDGPAIHFQHLNVQDRVKNAIERNSAGRHRLLAKKKEDTIPQGISPDELAEFHRLKEQYLD